MNLPSLNGLALLGALLLMAGCASSGPSSPHFGRFTPPGSEVLYPAPPDTARIQFLMAISGQGDLQGREGGGALVGKPYGLDLHQGRIYVCDLDVNGLTVLDLEGRVLRQARPGGAGALRRPVNCTVDPETGFLYVADAGRGDVVVLDTALVYVNRIGHDGGRAGDVFVERDTVWVSDMARGVVDVYEKASGKWVRSVGGEDTAGKSAMRQPANIWVQGGRLYVSDFGAFQVRVYDREGKLLQTVGEFGLNIGQFTRPKGIAVDSRGHIYVVDSSFANVQVFNEDGELLLFFGGPWRGLGGMWMPAGMTLEDDPAELARFAPYVLPGYELEYLILVASQYGPDKVGVYGFVRPREESVEAR